MEENKTYIFRRICETAFIELISSCLIYLLIRLEIIPSTKVGYVFGFGASTLVFLILNYLVLYAHFWAIHFNVKKYLAVNLSIFGVGAISSLIGLQYFSGDTYTMYFGYTKPFRQMFDMSAFESALLFWGLYLILIIAVLIRILYFDWACRQILKEEYEARLEWLEEQGDENVF